MSVWATTWAYEQTVRPVGRKFVLVCLASFADENGYCFPSQKTIADMTDQGVSTVREHLKALESDGVIERQHRYLTKDNGGRTSDAFRLKAPENRLKPPPKHLPPETSAKPGLTARSGGAYRQITGGLPPKSGGDLLVDQSKKNTLQRGTRLPDGFSVSQEMRIWAKKHAPHVELATALDEFNDYWKSIPGARGVKLDWEATWRNRMRELESRAVRNSSYRLPTQAEMNRGGQGKLVL